MGVGESKVKCICGHSVVRHFDLNAVKRANDAAQAPVNVSGSGSSALPEASAADLPAAILAALSLESPISQSVSSSGSPAGSSSRSSSPVPALTVSSSVPTSGEESEGHSPISGPQQTGSTVPNAQDLASIANNSLFSRSFAMGMDRRNRSLDDEIPSPNALLSEAEPDSPLSPHISFNSFSGQQAIGTRALVPPMLSNPVLPGSNRSSPPAITPPSMSLRSLNGASIGPSGSMLSSPVPGSSHATSPNSLSLTFSGLGNFPSQSMPFPASSPFGPAAGSAASFVPLPRCAGCDLKVPFIGAQLCGSDCARTYLQWSDYSHHLFQRCSPNSPQRARLGCSFCRRLGHVRRECANAAVKCEQCKENFHSWGTSNQCRFKGFQDKLEKFEGFWVYKEEFRSAQQRMAHAQATKLAQAQAQAQAQVQAQLQSHSVSHSLSHPHGLSNLTFPTQFSTLPGLDPIWRR